MKFLTLFAFFVIAILASGKVQAQGLEMMGAGGPPSQQKAFFRGTIDDFPSVKSANGTNETSLRRTGAIISYPFFLNEKDVFSVAFASQTLRIDSDAKLPVDGRRVDARWTNQSVGFSFAREMDGGRYWGAGINIGSASDQPFESQDVNTLSSTLSYSVPESETAHWMYLINYSNNRPILNGIPLPGIAYTMTPSKTFRGTFGIPFVNIKWEYAPNWILSSMVVGIWKAKIEQAYSIMGPIQVYTALDFDQQVFIRKDRRTDDVRFFADEKKALIGFRSPLNKNIMADLSAGQAFGRALFEVSSYSDRDDNKVDLGDVSFVAFSLGARF
jgi:hypothetical protein